METRVSPPLPPLPPEGQSAFEQMVSGKVEITRPQFEVILKDPTIRFMNFMGVTPPGTILVPIKIVPDPEKPEKPEKKEKKEFRPVQPIGPQTIIPTDVEAGYLVGPPDRIREMFHLLGISSPYSISMDLKHFGHDLFLQGRTGFLTTNRLPVGPDYMLGPGDELKVRVWGKVEGAWNLTIERDGTVRMPKVGVVALGGLTFEQGRDVLQKEFSRYYSGFEMNVTLGALRTMNVYVVGSARQPGAYTVSSLATLVPVLIQAGGPTKSGSMRDIQIRRGGKPVAHFDMYDFLRRGDKTGDQRLQPEDVVFIPPVGPVAAIAGSVNVPGLYELKGERIVSQLVELAGGLNTVAFKGRLQIERIVDSNRQVVFESDLEESKGKEVDLRSGDVFKVFQVVRDRRTVRITGAVQREGEFGFTPGMTVKDLVALSGGTKYYSYLKEAELTRMHVSDAGPKVEKMNVDLGMAIAGDPLANLPLQEDDQVFVRAIPEWRMYSEVSILGEFRFPGTYTVRRGEKLSSLIERAGGFTEKAYPRGAMFTRESVRELQQKRLMESIVRLERDLLIRASANLSAASSPEELKAKEAEVLLSKELIAKLKTVQATGSVEALRNSIYDIELENGDSLFIPENPRSLQALGAVFNQTAFVFDPAKNLPDYIELAGGYTEFADKDRVYVLKVNGSAVQPRESGLFLFSKSAYTTRDGKPLLEPGDSIVVPEKLERIAWLREIKDITQILFQIAVSAGVVIAAF
jgi:protein involved in polysaccharide export with SLBB domain